jgi:hypothetical protein
MMSMLSFYITDSYNMLITSYPQSPKIKKLTSETLSRVQELQISLLLLQDLSELVQLSDND